MIEKEHEQAQLKTYERIAQLDEETQERISQKYYHGTRPWLKKGDQPRRKHRKTNQPDSQEE